MIQERKDVMRTQFVKVIGLLVMAVILCVYGFANAADAPTIKVGAIFAVTGVRPISEDRRRKPLKCS